MHIIAHSYQRTSVRMPTSLIVLSQINSGLIEASQLSLSRRNGSTNICFLLNALTQDGLGDELA